MIAELPTKVTGQQVHEFQAKCFDDYVKRMSGEQQLAQGAQDVVQVMSARQQITGLLFGINDRAMLHILEGSTDAIMHILRRLNDEDGRALLSTTKICHFSEEIPREFPVYVFRECKVPTGDNESSTPKDFLHAVFTLYRSLLEIAHQQQSKSKDQAADYLCNSNVQKYVKLIPTVERIHAFTTCRDMCSINGFLEIFDAPIDLTLENELVFPAEPFLKF
jgi:hypothetical protein